MLNKTIEGIGFSVIQIESFYMYFEVSLHAKNGLFNYCSLHSSCLTNGLSSHYKNRSSNIFLLSLL
jgi:hypothetical protein